MRKTVLTILGSALIVATSVQFAAAAQRHHGKADRAIVTQQQTRNTDAYAAWLSAKTGETWRLPTDEEWVFAAGSRFYDDALSVAASRDPSVRWLARYEKMHWISGHAHPEPSARMNTDCSIYPGTSGNGRTPALFGNRLMQRASPLAFRPPPSPMF